MPTEFLHGIAITEKWNDPRPMDPAKMTTIAVIGTAGDGVDNSEWPINEPRHVFTDEIERIAALGTGGTLRDAFDAITDQGIIASVIAIRIEEGADTDATLANIVGSAAERTGVHALLDAQGELGFEPNILIAPGFTSQRPGDAANPVVAELLPIAERLRAVVVADGPNTTREDAFNYREDFDSDRLIIVDPHVKVWREGETAPAIQPASARIAGLGVKRDKQKGGPFWSWSNQPVGGIVGLARPISYYIDDPDSEANALNARQIATIFRDNGAGTGGQGGHIFWGNETAASDTLRRFYNVRRARDFVHKTILRTFRSFLGQYNITPHTVTQVLRSLDSFVSQLRAEGQILDGRVWFEGSLNTPEEMRRGKLQVELALEPAPPLQTLEIDSMPYRVAYETLITAVERDLQNLRLAA